MKKIILEGALIDNREQLYENLKMQMQSEVFEGNNLDAFYDALTEEADVIELEILDEDQFRNNLGTYAERFVRVYKEYRRELEL